MTPKTPDAPLAEMPKAKPDPEKVMSAEEFAAELQREAQGCGYDWRQGHFEAVLLAAIQARDATLADAARAEEREKWAGIAEQGGYGFDVMYALKHFAARLRENRT